MLKAHEIFDWVHIIAYMINPITKEYGTRLILSSSSQEPGHYALLVVMRCYIGMRSSLESFVLNFFKILSKYALGVNLISHLYLSLYILYQVYTIRLPSPLQKNISQENLSYFAILVHHFQWVVCHRPNTRKITLPLLAITYMHGLSLLLENPNAFFFSSKQRFMLEMLVWFQKTASQSYTIYSDTWTIQNPFVGSINTSFESFPFIKVVLHAFFIFHNHDILQWQVYPNRLSHHHWREGFLKVNSLSLLKKIVGPYPKSGDLRK